ncbi:hypothetical protein FISHEDRAFT_76140 [Fistulina hepatica ATCC 64428]|uniref:Uncharacterized protein n=1 Tax=Fistulina hepatica ATCC 64428 TaxID=1128425 RepID=A0A0D7A7L9_9AGAR|nr:hypothetical protein FISHEDRAFT_76140 [Fistulina hepatica ATCC 64428]
MQQVNRFCFAQDFACNANILNGVVLPKPLPLRKTSPPPDKPTVSHEQMPGPHAQMRALDLLKARLPAPPQSITSCGLSIVWPVCTTLQETVSIVFELKVIQWNMSFGLLSGLWLYINGSFDEDISHVRGGLDYGHYNAMVWHRWLTFGTAGSIIPACTLERNTN